jgi:hypothetical protein
LRESQSQTQSPKILEAGFLDREQWKSWLKARLLEADFKDEANVWQSEILPGSAYTLRLAALLGSLSAKIAVNFLFCGCSACASQEPQ